MHPDSDTAYPPDGDEIADVSLFQLLTSVLRHRYYIATVTAVIASVLLLWTLVAPHSYTATTSFIPQLDGVSRSQLAALAGQFGIATPGAQTSQSPEFYGELVRSRKILFGVIEEPFAFLAAASETDSVILAGTLPDLLEIDEDTPEVERREEAVAWLRDDAIDAVPDVQTGVVTVSVTTPWAGLSGDIASRIVEQLHQFNVATRQSQAAAERVFVQGRMTEAQDTLRLAEDALQRFLQSNRSFENSPELTFEHDRLQREVAMRQEVYTSLAQAHEEARISEVRNTPIITVIDEPAVPVLPNPKRYLIVMFVGVVLGLMIGIALAMVREGSARAREQGSDDYRQFRTLWDEAVDDLRGLLRRERKR